ncbi:hypothetical protein Lser_V15G40520 [Lactuca serriola]
MPPSSLFFQRHPNSFIRLIALILLFSYSWQFEVYKWGVFMS